MWQKMKLEIHFSIYKDSLHAFNVELATARQTFFSNLINSNLNNTRTLLAALETDSDSKCNEFASFFSEKINNIRKVMSTSLCRGHTDSTAISKIITMSVFEAIDSKVLEKRLEHLKSSTCYLDTLPTFKSVLNCLEADLLEVLNEALNLFLGLFPENCSC